MKTRCRLFDDYTLYTPTQNTPHRLNANERIRIHYHAFKIPLESLYVIRK